MKIRNGFVSNSSSSSFIVYVPENFEINEAVIKYTMDRLTHYYDKENLQEIAYLENGDINEEGVAKLRDMAKTLKAGEDVYEDDDYGTAISLIDILKVWGLVLGGIETGPDGGIISSVTRQEINTLIDTVNKKEWLQI